MSLCQSCEKIVINGIGKYSSCHAWYTDELIKAFIKFILTVIYYWLFSQINYWIIFVVWNKYNSLYFSRLQEPRMTRTLFRRKKFRCLKPISPTSYWNDKNYEKRCGNDSTRCNSRDRQTQEVWILLHRRCATSNNNSIAMLSLWWASKLSWFSFSPSSLFFFLMNFAEITGINEWKLENLKLTWLVLVYVLLSFCSTKIYFSAHCQKFIISS